MRDLFISYARENKPAVDQLVDHLDVVGYRTWVDSSLRGGQDWWREILSRITGCDVFIVILSQEALNSTACGLEREWAAALGKPMLPVAIEPLSTALPKSLSTLQIVDYSDPGRRDRAALTLAGALAALPATPAPPDPLPVPPEAPLSYLTDLVDQVARPDSIDHERQRQIVSRLETALRSVDPEERRGGSDILARFRGRDDLYADVDRALTQLADVYGSAAPAAAARPTVPAPAPAPTPAQPEGAGRRIEPEKPPPGPATRRLVLSRPPAERSEAPEKRSFVAPTAAEAPAEPTSQAVRFVRISGVVLIVFGALSVVMAAVGWFGSDYLWALYSGDWDPTWVMVGRAITLLLLAIAFGTLARALQLLTSNIAAAACSAVVGAASVLQAVVNLAAPVTFSYEGEGETVLAPLFVAAVVFVALIADGVTMALSLRRRWPLLAAAAGVLGAIDVILVMGQVWLGSMFFYWVLLMWVPLLLALGIALVRFRPGATESPSTS